MHQMNIKAMSIKENCLSFLSGKKGKSHTASATKEDHSLGIFNFSSFLQTQILMLPVLLLFYQDNGLTAGDLFLFQGIFSITALLFEVPAGYIGDIFPRRSVLIFSYLLFMARLCLWMAFSGYWIVLAGEILYSMNKAFYTGVADGYVYDYLKSKHKTSRMLHGYGKLNFWMSVGTALAALIGPVLYKYFNSFMVLLVIEFILNTAAVILLFMLPKVPSTHKHTKGLKTKYVELSSIIKNTLKNKQLSLYIYYSGILAATTLIFVWSFQPLMILMGIPTALFGVVYFFNHIFRAMAGFFLPQTIKIFSLERLGKIVFGLFIVAFISVITITHIQSVVIGMGLLIFICIVIGFQLSFTMASISRLHTLTPSHIRSTTASVNYMVSRSMAGIMQIMFKFVLDGFDLSQSFSIYLALFCLSFIPLHQLLKLPKTTPVDMEQQQVPASA